MAGLQDLSSQDCRANFWQKMIDLARTNAEKLSATNVEFIHTNINHLPLPDNSIDCVMSNCVLNLVPEDDKLLVIKEIHRILKPCGRLAVNDFLALKPLTPEIKDDPALHAGCVSGALEVGQMKDFLFEIGFDGT
jgi:arsenite methyltransferase